MPAGLVDMPIATTHDQKDEALRLGVYRHYKHTTADPRYYLVIAVGRHTETEESLVAYVPLYPAGGPRMAFRPLDLFLNPAMVDGREVERFTYVGTEIPEYSV